MDDKSSMMPDHGPYAEPWFDVRPGAKKWRLRLTEDGKQFVVNQIEKWNGKTIKLLWRSHRALCRRAVRIDGEEAIEQHCRVGMTIAALKYRPERGEFSTYASWVMRLVVQLSVEDQKTCQTLYVIASRKNGSRTGVKFVRGFIDDPDDYVVNELSRVVEDDYESDRLIVKNKVDEWLDRVPKRNAKIVRDYIMGERTLQSIGDELGISKERVRQLVESTKIKLGYIIKPSEYQRLVTA